MIDLMAICNTVEMVKPNGRDCFHRDCNGKFKPTRTMWGKPLHWSVDYAYKCNKCDEVVFDKMRK